MAAPSEFDTRQTVVNRVDPFIEAAGTAFTGRLTPLLNPANAVNTGAFAQKVQGQNKLQQQALQQAATQGGLGTLQFSGPGGTVSGISGIGTGTRYLRVRAYDQGLASAWSDTLTFTISS